MGGSLRAQPLNSLSFWFLFLSEAKEKETPPEGQDRLFAGESERGVQRERLHARFCLAENCHRGTGDRWSPLQGMQILPHRNGLLRLRLLRRRHGNLSSQMKFATLRGAMCYFAERCVTSRSDVLLRGAMCYFAKRCVTSRSDVLLCGAMCYFAKRCVTSRSDVLHPPLTRSPFPSQHLTFGSSCTVIFDQVRKARVYIKILCQHKIGSVKSNSDHRNSISRECPPLGATIGIQLHGNAPRRGAGGIL